MNLKEQIIKANIAYRSGEPIISDEEYDSLLEKLEDEIGMIEFECFKQTLTEEKGTVKLDYVIGSLKKIKYEDNVVDKWVNENKVTELFVSQKIDGCSVVCNYSKGKLVKMVSRGDGYESTDWSDKMNYINIPQHISFMEDLTIRGELTLINDDYKVIGYKNKRNGTVGIMNSKEVESDKLNFVHAFFYEILSNDMKIKEQFKFLESHGFKTPSYKILSI